MKKLWIISAIGVIIVLSVVGVWFFVANKEGKEDEARLDNDSATTSSAAQTEQIQKDNATLLDKINKVAEVDQDLDGLTNEVEKKYSTDPDNPDSDGDGLLDKDELFTYRTNPLNSDTDGDAFLDGYEVDRLTDPLKAK
jgi:hypothetical protein